MKKIPKDDKNYIDRMTLWAAGIKGRIEVLDFEIASMAKQITRNTRIRRLEECLLADSLKDYNKWRKLNGYPTVKSL